MVYSCAVTRLEDRYNQLVAQGWTPAGALPFVDVPVGDGVGTWFTYATATGVNVAIYDNPNIGTFEVHGAILVTYQGQGGPLSSLGYPTSDEHDDYVGDTVVGRVNDFERGSIFWSSSSLHTTVMTIGPVTAEVDIIDGIDVSGHQGIIDWAQVAGPGSQGFAYIKATEGNTVTDAKFSDNWSASSGQLPRGAYHYFNPTVAPDQARQQADHFVDTLQATGDIGELPPMVDVEVSSVTPAQAAASLQFYLSIVEQGIGRRPVIYTFPSFWSNEMAGAAQFASAYKLWIANYGARRADKGFETKTGGPAIPPGWSDWAIWQHAILPGMAGIGTLVDRDLVMVPSGTSVADFLK
jgi:GH25 family lysozyme M1 (1,4-beta-N-acetylmuramidase)